MIDILSLHDVKISYQFCHKKYILLQTLLRNV